MIRLSFRSCFYIWDHPFSTYALKGEGGSKCVCLRTRWRGVLTQRVRRQIKKKLYTVFPYSWAYYKLKNSHYSFYQLGYCQNKLLHLSWRSLRSNNRLLWILVSNASCPGIEVDRNIRDLPFGHFKNSPGNQVVSQRFEAYEIEAWMFWSIHYTLKPLLRLFSEGGGGLRWKKLRTQGGRGGLNAYVCVFGGEGV